MRPIDLGLSFLWSVSDPVCAPVSCEGMLLVWVKKNMVSVVKTIHLDLLQWFVLLRLRGKSKYYPLTRRFNDKFVSFIKRISTENEFRIRKVSQPWSTKLAHHSYVLLCLPFKNHTWTSESGHENRILKVKEICTKGVMQYSICLHDIMSTRNSFWPFLPAIVRCPAFISFPGHT